MTVHNGTDEELKVMVGAGHDFAIIDSILLGAKGTGVVCPLHDSSIQLVVTYGRDAHILDLDVYTHADAIGSASATIVGRAGEVPRLEDVTHESGYSVWSVLPHGLFVRGAGVGLALGLLVAAWASRRGWRRGQLRSGPVSSGSPLPDQ